jgi:hypothetical protein
MNGYWNFITVARCLTVPPMVSSPLPGYATQAGAWQGAEDRGRDRMAQDAGWGRPSTRRATYRITFESRRVRLTLLHAMLGG